ncbi:hypothetical protein ANCCAN_08953 [Ancylostoma caninum]|uniref:Uncharacterized protein n=1 Tax=Ancylostoma caninum TaxID=29170 RepID=A0A368GPP6_ANCCA|nr:hypothetical protein ANCCAN_08953 [Ancylostoma caninum]
MIFEDAEPSWSLRRSCWTKRLQRRSLVKKTSGVVHIRLVYSVNIRESTLRRRIFQPGPPAPPDPVLYNKQFAVAPSKVQSEVQHEPAIFSKQTRYLPPTSRVTPFDSDIDPNFPSDAPRARGLVGEGSQGTVDVEFRTGYRWRAAPPVLSFHRSFEIGPRGRQTVSFWGPTRSVVALFISMASSEFSDSFSIFTAQHPHTEEFDSRISRYRRRRSQ